MRGKGLECLRRTGGGVQHHSARAHLDSRDIPCIVVLTVALAACGDKGHPEPLEDYLESCGAADAGCSQGSQAEGRSEIPYECITEEQAADFDKPLTSVIEAFENDTFFPDSTRPISGTAALKTLGQIPFTFACLETEAGERFDLLGGNSTDEAGGLRIDPVGHDAFKPTMIQKVRRSDLELPAIPVVATEEWDDIFDDLSIRPKKNKGQVLVEVAFVPAPGARYRQSMIEIRSAAAEAVAYRVGGEWTTEATETGGDGLALLVNVTAEDGLGLLLPWSYVNHARGNFPEEGHESMYAIKGGITYLAFQPTL